MHVDPAILALRGDVRRDVLRRGGGAAHAARCTVAVRPDRDPTPPVPDVHTWDAVAVIGPLPRHLWIVVLGYLAAHARVHVLRRTAAGFANLVTPRCGDLNRPRVPLHVEARPTSTRKTVRWAPTVARDAE